MNPAIAIRKTPDGRIQARRKDGKPLTPEDREEARRFAAMAPVVHDDPVLTPDQWYPSFRDFHHSVVRESADFDYGELHKRAPELYRRIKTKEKEIDDLGEARLSDVIALMRDWRELILKCCFDQRRAKSSW